MKAVTWHGKRDVRVDDGPRPDDRGADRRDHPGHLDRDLRLRPAPVRGARRRSSTRATSSATSRWASSRRSAATVTHIAARRPGRDPVQHLLRPLLHVRAGAAVAVRDDPGARARHGRGAVRLHEALRPGARRPGRVPARAAGAVRPDQGAARARPTTASSTSPTCCRPRGRRSSTPTCPTGGSVVVLGLGPIGDMAARIAQHRGAEQVIGVDLVPERLAARRDRAASRRSTSTSTTTTCRRRDPRADRRARPRRRHRRRRHGGPRLAASRKLAQQARRRCCPTRSRSKLMQKAGIDRLAALHMAIDIVRRGGTISLSGVYGGMADPLPMLHAVRQADPAADGPGQRASAGSTTSCRCSRRRRPARRRRLRDPPPAARRGARRPTRCSRRRQDGAVKVLLRP